MMQTHAAGLVKMTLAGAASDSARVSLSPEFPMEGGDGEIFDYNMLYLRSVYALTITYMIILCNLSETLMCLSIELYC